jgi:hypothetical protein
MAGGAIIDAVHGGTTDINRTEAPITMKTYLMCGKLPLKKGFNHSKPDLIVLFSLCRIRWNLLRL